jgi:hypothetical protein
VVTTPVAPPIVAPTPVETPVAPMPDVEPEGNGEIAPEEPNGDDTEIGGVPS